jgi:hypothetical protein
MDQMLVWTFIHRQALQARANRKPVDITDIYEDNLLFPRVGRLLERARSWRWWARQPTCDSGRQDETLAGEGICSRSTCPYCRNVP